MSNADEPLVRCADVARLVAPYVTADNEDTERLAEAAGCSMRTFWRLLSGAHFEWIALDRADRLLTAVGESVNSCHLKLPDGTIEEPWYGN